MKRKCPVCGTSYGIFDRITQPTMCGACFSAQRVAAHVAEVPDIVAKDDVEFEHPGIAKSAIGFAVRLCGALLFCPFLVVGMALTDEAPGSVSVFSIIAVVGFIYTAVVSFIIPGLVVEDRMRVSEAIGLVTLWTPATSVVRSVAAMLRQRSDRRYKSPFHEK